MNKSFLLGCGAQKAGTSWIQSHLAGRPEANFGQLKEYHTFDALHLPEYAHVAVRRDPSLLHRPRRFLSYLFRMRRLPGDEGLRRRLRVGDAYFDYFMGLLAQPGVTLTGDVTPDYSGLPPEVFAKVRAEFARRNIRVLAMFLMRDPVQRCISAIRMYRGRPAGNHLLPIKKEDSTSAALLALYSSRRFEMLTRYDVTLASVDSVFPPDDVLTGFYEDLFTESEVRRIEVFCGVSNGVPDLSRKINSSGFKGEAVSEEAAAAVARHYRPVYEFAANRYGRAEMEARWPSYGYL